MEMIRFTVPAMPVAQPRQRHRVVHAGGRAFARNYTPTRDPVNAFKAAVALAASVAYRGAPHAGPVSVSCVFVFARPQAMRWKTKPMPRARHCGKPDIDNVYKALVDALSGQIFVDDAQVYSAVLEKSIAAGDEPPHCEVTICLEDCA